MNPNTTAQNQSAAHDVQLAPVAKWGLTGLSLSMLMSSLDTSIANAGLPTLAQAFSAPFQEVQWVILAYLLVITTLIVSVGKLGDLVGRKRLLLAGITLFTVASLLCGLAPTLMLLVTARAVQGLGAAVMMALTMAFVGETVPKEKTGSAMGLLGTMSAVGTTLGPSLGGMLMAGMGWRSIFLINVPLGILNFFIGYRYLPSKPRDDNAPRVRFDILGTLFFAITLASYALAMTLGHGHMGLANMELLGGAVLGLLLFLLVENKANAPLIRLSMFRDAGLGAGLTMSALVATVMMSTLVVGPFYLSRALGLPTAYVGLALSVGPLMAALAGVPSGRIVDRFGGSNMTIFGLVGVALGCVALSVIPSSFGLAGYLGPIVVITSSYALFQAANNTSIMAGVKADQRGVVSGMLSLSRNLGLITGASVMGAVFSMASAGDVAAVSPEAVASGMRTTFSAAVALIIAALYVAIRSRSRAAAQACACSRNG